MKRRTYDKKDKGLVVAMLALGFLAGCTKPPVEDSVEKVYHTVEFYEDNVGKFYKEVEVEDGTKVENQPILLLVKITNSQVGGLMKPIVQNSVLTH